MKQVYLFLISASLFALPALAQGDDLVDVEGRVVRAGTTVGIPDATVRLNNEQTTSGPNGEFHFRTERRNLVLSATRQGYTRAAIFLYPDKGKVPANDDRPYLLLGQPVLLEISPSAGITGTLTGPGGKPLEGVTIEFVRVFDLPPRVALNGGTRVTSNAEGEFSFLPRDETGSYALRVVPEMQRAPIQTHFDPEWNIAEQSYPPTYWPGGGDKRSLLPLQLGDGKPIDVGKIRIDPVPAYLVLVKFPASACGGDDAFFMASLVHETHPPDLLGSPMRIACGTDMLLHGLTPGAYSLRLNPVNAPVEQRRFGRLRFEITDDNLERTIELESGATLEGRVTMPGGLKQDGNPFAGLRISVNSFPANTGIVEAAQVQPDGSFRAENIPLERLNVALIGDLPGDLGVTRITLHGLALPPQLPPELTQIDWEGIGPLEFRVGTASGVIDATIPGKEEDRLTLLLAPWPSLEGVPPMRHPTNGRFRVSGVPAGEYEMWVLPWEAMMVDLGDLMSELGPGTRVKLKGGESATVELELPQSQ